METKGIKSIADIAEICGCSQGMVSMVLENKRNQETKLAKKIIYTARLLRENKEAEIARQKRIAAKIKSKLDKQV